MENAKKKHYKRYKPPFTWRTVTRKIFPVAVWSLLLIWTIVFLAQLFWGLVTSVKSAWGFYIDPIFFPKGKEMWQFSNYAAAFKNIRVQITNTETAGFFRMLVNSLLFAVGNAFLSVLTAALASYILAKYNRIRWVGALWAIVLITNYLPISSSTAANIKLLNDLGLFDSMLGNWLWSCGAFGAVFLMYYASWKGLSWGYAEAAFIDGAGHFRTMWQIMLPMTRTIFGVLFLMQFITLWNDYMTPLIYLPSFPTLSYGAWLLQYTTNYETADITVKIAGLLLIAFPVFVLFMCFKEKLMGSLTIGGLKG